MWAKNKFYFSLQPLSVNFSFIKNKCLSCQVSHQSHKYFLSSQKYLTTLPFISRQRWLKWCGEREVNVLRIYKSSSTLQSISTVSWALTLTHRPAHEEESKAIEASDCSKDYKNKSESPAFSYRFEVIAHSDAFVLYKQRHSSVQSTWNFKHARTFTAYLPSFDNVFSDEMFTRALEKAKRLFFPETKIKCALSAFRSDLGFQNQRKLKNESRKTTEIVRRHT